MLPDLASASPVIGQAPPDQVQMSLADHYAGALSILRSRGVSPEEMMETRAFMEAFQQIIMEQTQPQPGMEGGGPTGPAAEMNGDEEPYGGGGQPVDTVPWS
jgi:hypothetical protein